MVIGAIGAEGLFIGYRMATTLALAGMKHGASEAELTSITRLQDFAGTPADVDQLRRLAELAGLTTEGLPWWNQ